MILSIKIIILISFVFAANFYLSGDIGKEKYTSKILDIKQLMALITGTGFESNTYLITFL